MKLRLGLSALVFGVGFWGCSGTNELPLDGGADPDVEVDAPDTVDEPDAIDDPGDADATEAGDTVDVADTGAGDGSGDAADTRRDADPYCGDGYLDDDEECDDGNNDDYDGCDADCKVEVCVRGSDTDEDGTDDCDDVEECDGIDNNGNGAIDEFPVDEGIGDDCYTGPEGTEGVGICTAGERVCRLGEIVCTGDVTPQFDELCNDLDDDCDGVTPPEELELGCSTDIVVTPTPFTARFEVATPPRAVDVVFDIDTTGSMGGVLDGLRTDLRDVIAPAVQSVLPDAAFAVSTFEDFPFGDFGDATDLPFELWQRVTSDIDAVQAALDRISLGSGADSPESGIEALYQIATGAGSTWPVGLVEAGETVPPTVGTMAYLGETVPDVDDFRVALEPGDVLRAEVIASRIGSPLDPMLRLYEPEIGWIASNDDALGSLDSLIEHTATFASTYVVRVSACCGAEPSWGSGDSWYVLAVTVNGVPYLPDAVDCTSLEVGEDTSIAVPLVTEELPALVAEEARPSVDADTCRSDCADLPAYSETWVDAFCVGSAALGSCGDGSVGLGEECDDGNTEGGDGCSATCLEEVRGVPPFDPRPGFSTALGHGRIGGVGFRAGAVPVVIHATDVTSHPASDYLAFDAGIDAHDAAETFEALDLLGVRVIGVASSTSAVGGPAGDLRYLDQMVARTESRVPLCAFDDSVARLDGPCGAEMCCTGLAGAGVSPDDEGQCPLVFSVSGSGTGLSTAIVEGIAALASFRGEPVTARIVAGPGVPERAACLVSALEVTDVVRPGDCLPELELADLDGDGLPETVLNATPSTRATFTFTAVNVDTRDVDGDDDFEEPCLDPGSYPLSFQLLDAAGEVIFSQRVNVTIPAD